jgi:hypothetical protein
MAILPTGFRTLPQRTPQTQLSREDGEALIIENAVEIDGRKYDLRIVRRDDQGNVIPVYEHSRFLADSIEKIKGYAQAVFETMVEPADSTVTYQKMPHEFCTVTANDFEDERGDLIPNLREIDRLLNPVVMGGWREDPNGILTLSPLKEYVRPQQPDILPYEPMDEEVSISQDPVTRQAAVSDKATHVSTPREPIAEDIHILNELVKNPYLVGLEQKYDKQWTRLKIIAKAKKMELEKKTNQKVSYYEAARLAVGLIPNLQGVTSDLINELAKAIQSDEYSINS